MPYLSSLRSKLSLDTLNEAITAILTQSQEKKRNFVETVELQICEFLIYLTCNGAHVHVG